MMEKEIKKKEGIKGISLKKIKIKIKSRIKNNLINLIKRRFFILIIFLPDFARRVNTINI